MGRSLPSRWVKSAELKPINQTLKVAGIFISELNSGCFSVSTPVLVENSPNVEPQLKVHAWPPWVTATNFTQSISLLLTMRIGVSFTLAQICLVETSCMPNGSPSVPEIKPQSLMLTAPPLTLPSKPNYQTSTFPTFPCGTPLRKTANTIGTNGTEILVFNTNFLNLSAN